MRILIQKFGGTSLSSKQARELVIQHIKRERENGYAVVVVVSAMGRVGEPYATDSLLALLPDNPDACDEREKDMLISCGEMISAVTLTSEIREAGVPVTAFSAFEAGIETDHDYGMAKIIAIKPDRIIEALEAGLTVVVTGFQGRTKQGDITTLGRGGSDTTATAIGAVLRAEMVDIYTDVQGVLTADPRFVEEAKPISRVTYAEICHMAREGAKVVHPRAVEIAQQARIPVRIRSTFSEDEGTLVQDYEWKHNEHTIVDRHVTGIAHVSGLTQIQAEHPDNQDESLLVFQTMAAHGISVDFINVSANRSLFTVKDSEAIMVQELLAKLDIDVNIVRNCAKISVIGGGMNGQPGVMAKVVRALTESRTPILQSADSNAAIWVLVPESEMIKAMVTLHSTFDLNR